jgi:hypothetical protein
MPKYKDKAMQALYDGLLRLAADKTSELYWKGEPRRGAAHRCAFWDGFKGARSPLAVPRTITYACYMAGREFARRSAK